MTRIHIQHLVVVAAILHLSVDAAFASSAVLCLGADGHTAVEAEHKAFANHTAPGQTVAAATVALIGVAPAGCLDAPLHPDCAEIASTRIDGSEIVSRSTLVSATRVAPPPAGPSTLASTDTASALPPGMRSHHITVLQL